MRTDPATHFLGMRLNDWVSIVVFLGALVYFVRVRGEQEHVVPPASEEPVASGDLPDSSDPAPTEDDESETASRTPDA